MTTPDPPDRLFDEEEITRILQRTAELQGQRRQAPTTGLTLEELKALATESGLDPSLVLTAVTEMQSGTQQRGSSWWGGPMTHTRDIALPGPVSDHAWERMLDAVRSVMGQIGRVEERGTTREWIMDQKDEGTGRFSVREEADGSSRVHLIWTAPIAAIVAYIVQGVLSLMMLPLVFEEFALGLLPGVPVYLAIVGTLFLLMRWIVSRASTRNQARTEELMRVVASIGAAESVTTTPSGSAEEVPSSRTEDREVAPSDRAGVEEHDPGGRLLEDEPDRDDESDDERPRNLRERSVRRRTAAAFLAVLLVGCTADLPDMSDTTPFAWSQDARWEAYESAFLEARAEGCEFAGPRLDVLLVRLGDTIESLWTGEITPSDPLLDRLEEDLFGAAPLAAVCRTRLPAYQRTFVHMRDALKHASMGWDLSAREDRERLYRLLYGGRAAMEEAMLQGPLDDAEPILVGRAKLNPSVPHASVTGVTIQSGDLLLSRGGAASSALIARGNDFPGNFSHVALARVDSDSGKASVIEAHIEKGVVPASADDYLADHKLRILVLRPRADLPALTVQPETPHLAADDALHEATRRHIPYDFALDFERHDRMFCSEVAFAAYRGRGLNLWMGMSTMSAPGLVRWLHAVGVRHFETHEPSDLEYDPQLEVVAEWIDPATLWKDHVDNAVIDVLLEGADAGDELDYSVWTLPVAAATKAWSWILNRFGRVGPVPEGMGPVTALRIRSLTARHAKLVDTVLDLSVAYEREHGYRPPYWDLVGLARTAKEHAD